MSKKMKLLLALPQQEGLLKGVSGGLVSLYEYIRHNKGALQLDVEILDYSIFTDEEVKIDTLQYETEENLIIGITTTTASYQSALYVAKNYKRSNPNCVIVFGGHHATADAKTILLNHKKTVDYIISGEGEKSLFEFVKNYPKINEVPNLIFIDEKGEFRTNKPASLLKTDDLNMLSLYENSIEKYKIDGKFGTITYISARGCPLRCSFCAVANQKMRSLSVGKVKKDILSMVKSGFFDFAIEDNFFAHSPKRTIELCLKLEEIKKEYPKFKWDCQTRVESLKNIDIIKAMDNAGCYAVYVGVEALNEKHLNYLGKTKNGVRYLDILFNQALPNVLETNIDFYINLQLGIPNSDNSEFKHTMKNLKKLGRLALKKKREITVFPMLHVIYPGTVHFQNGILNGYWKSDVFEYFTKWEKDQVNLYGWMGDNFAHGTGGIPQSILDAEKLKTNEFVIETEEVLNIQKQLNEIKKVKGIKIFNYEPHINKDKY